MNYHTHFYLQILLGLCRFFTNAYLSKDDS